MVAIVLMDGPLAPVSLGIGQGDAEEYKVPRSSAGPMPGFETADKRQGKVKDVTQKAQNAAQGITDKTKDLATIVADKAQDVSKKLSDTAFSAKSAAGATVPTTWSALGEIGNSTASGVSAVGISIWVLFQCNPLQESPLAIGAMALAVGAGLGLAVPKSSYENQLSGKTRDDLVGKVQGQAQDIAQKVATVALTPEALTD